MMGFNDEFTAQSNLYERVKKLLISFEYSDCCFSISGKLMKAHKLILGISSPVFEAMLYGPLSSNSEIIITDIEPDIFQLLLNYIYTDTVELVSIDQAFELLYASRKYLLDHLSKLCISYILTNVCIDNVVDVLNYPDYLQDSNLKSFALKLFCEHASYILQENKNIITFSCMKAVLESDYINIKEVDLIKHLFCWTKYYCKQNNLPVTNENRQDVLFNKGLYRLLRFHTLSLDEIEDIKIAGEKFLFPQQLDHIKNIIISHQNNNVLTDIITSNADVLPRNPLKLISHFCHRNPIKSMAPLQINTNNSTVHCRLKTNKSLFIKSFCIPTRMIPVVLIYNNMPKCYSENITIRIIAEAENKLIKLANFKNTVEYGSIVDIEISEPCFIKKNKWYKVSLSWPKNKFETYSYVLELRERIYNGYRTKIEFDDISTGLSGSFVEGFKFCL